MCALFVLLASAQPAPFALRQVGVINNLTGVPTLSGLGTNTTGVGSTGIPDFCASPTSTAVKSGSWSSADTWDVVPAANGRILIPSGFKVAYDQNVATAYKCVGVKGLLWFSRTGTLNLRTSELLVYGEGELNIGTEREPVTGDVSVEFDGTIDTGTDAQAHGVGFIGLGVVLINGNLLTPVTRLTAEVGNGASSVTASNVTGWQAGDEIIFPDTREIADGSPTGARPWTPQTLTVQSISGSTVTFTGTASHAYPGRRDGSSTLESYPPVGNLSRNIVFRSVNPGGVRGHIIFAGASVGRINFFRIEDMGRTLADQDTTNGSGANPIGRYALHLHQLGNANFTSDGVSIVRSKKWGVTVHDTNFSRFSRPVIYDADGWGAGFEDGGETDNILEYGLIVDVDGDGGEQGSDHKNVGEWGRNGVCVWMQSPTNIVRGMIGANCRVSGYSLWDTLDNDDSGPQRILPAGYFENNEAIANWAGIQNFNIGFDTTETSYITNFVTWHNTKFGYYGYPSGNFLIQNMVIRGDPAQMPKSESIYNWFGDYDHAGVILDGADISSLTYGFRVPYGSAPPAMSAGSTRTNIIRNSTFNNNGTDISLLVTGTSQGDQCGVATFVAELRNNTHGSLSTVHVEKTYVTGGPIRQRHRVMVYDFNGDTSDDFEVFALQQDGGESFPQGTGSGSCGCTSSAMTNTQCWAAHTQATFGEITPGGATTRSKITNKIVEF
jgi:hypothetical protein